MFQTTIQWPVQKQEFWKPGGKYNEKGKGKDKGKGKGDVKW